MSDVDTAVPTEGDAPAGDGPDLSNVTPEDMISRGKGVKAENLEAGSAASQAFEDFKALVARRNDAVKLGEELTEERNAAIYELKNTHNVSFGSIAEVIEGTSSLAMYLYERAQGKSAKQIREESQRSAAAKALYQESTGTGKPARKQSPEEKALRKRQREELKTFLEQQKAEGVDVGDADPDQPVEDDDDT